MCLFSFFFFLLGKGVIFNIKYFFNKDFNWVNLNHCNNCFYLKLLVYINYEKSICKSSVKWFCCMDFLHFPRSIFLLMVLIIKGLNIVIVLYHDGIIFTYWNTCNDVLCEWLEHRSNIWRLLLWCYLIFWNNYPL